MPSKFTIPVCKLDRFGRRVRVCDGVGNKLADREEGLSYSSCLSMCLVIRKVSEVAQKR